MVQRFYTTSRRGWTIRLACAFALFGVALAASVNVVDDAVHKMALAWSAGPVDMTTTAGISRPGHFQNARRERPARKRYRVRRSVLHPKGESCTIYSDGTSAGSC